MALDQITVEADPFTKGKRRSVGDLWESSGTFRFGATYSTGGELLTSLMTALGAKFLMDLRVDATGSDTPTWDKSNKKVKLFTADGVEAANGATPNVTVRFTARFK